MTFNLRTSQSFQDVFAYQIVGNNGTYIEIGAREPISMSNTYNLETEGGWTNKEARADISGTKKKEKILKRLKKER